MLPEPVQAEPAARAQPLWSFAKPQQQALPWSTFAGRKITPLTCLLPKGQAVASSPPCYLHSRALEADELRAGSEAGSRHSTDVAESSLTRQIALCHTYSDLVFGCTSAEHLKAGCLQGPRGRRAA